MGLEGAAFSACLDPIPLSSGLALGLLCYPRPEGTCDAAERVYELESAGVEALCLMGPTRLDFMAQGLRVLGKGHSSVVVAARSGHGLVAVKVRRSDSKRGSLASEARRLLAASRAGASPKVFFYSDNVIVMDYLGTVRLGALLELGGRTAYVAALEALRAARALDTAHILHQELHRPQGNVMYPYWPLSPRAVIVDLESASEGCGNVNKVASFIIGSMLRLERDETPEKLRTLLASYKEGGCPAELYKELEPILVGLIRERLRL